MIDVGLLQRKLERLRKADRQFALFGSSEHRYQRNPCLTEDEVGMFEARHGIRLPEDYRMFLTSLGNGGAGPYYGLFPLGHTGERQLGNLDRPFPHAAPWNPAKIYHKEHPDPYRDEASRLAYRAFEKMYFGPECIQGSLPICHEGCGYYDLLVVTGAGRGNVWTDGRVSDQGIVPILAEDGRHLSFIDWYCGWLDGSLAELGIRT